MRLPHPCGGVVLFHIPCPSYLFGKCDELIESIFTSKCLNLHIGISLTSMYVSVGLAKGPGFGAIGCHGR